MNFQTHFKTLKDEDEGDTITTSYLVAESNFFDDPEASTKINDELLHQIDDFLLIASFATRQRCVCLGWEVYDSRGHTQFYRRNISIPKHDREHRVDDGVIRPEHFETFLQAAYQRFVNEPSLDLLRAAISAVIPREGSTIEAQFTRIFSAIETLVLMFRRQHNLEFVFHDQIEQQQWGETETRLRTWLKEQPLLNGNDESKKEKRKLIYENLSALQRISFSYAFKKFSKFYQLELTDLWGISGGADNLSLTAIRNKLVHGDDLGDYKTGALATATDHLRWTLERMILAVLGWDIEYSYVNPDYLSTVFNAYRDKEADRKLISSRE